MWHPAGREISPGFGLCTNSRSAMTKTDIGIPQSALIITIYARKTHSFLSSAKAKVKLM